MNRLTLIYFTLQGLFLHPNKAAPESAVQRKYFYFDCVLALCFANDSLCSSATTTFIQTKCVNKFTFPYEILDYCSSLHANDS